MRGIASSFAPFAEEADIGYSKNSSIVDNKDDGINKSDDDNNIDG